MEKTIRDEGFYKVKWNGRWIIALYCYHESGDFFWWLTGDDCDYADCDFEEIGERIELPENLKTK